jgi:hypothetical protein
MKKSTKKSKPKKSARRGQSKSDDESLSPELSEEVARFFTHVSPKHFGRALRDAIVEISSNDVGRQNYLDELLEGCEMLFHVLDKAEDEGKYCSSDIYQR